MINFCWWIFDFSLFGTIMINASMSILIQVFWGSYVFLKSFPKTCHSQLWARGYEQSITNLCVKRHHKHSNFKQPPFYLLINSMDQKSGLVSAKQLICWFLLGSFILLPSSGSSARMRWSKLALSMCLACSAGCQSDVSLPLYSSL